MELVEIYTDGACRGNPGPGGWGVLFREREEEKEEREKERAAGVRRRRTRHFYATRAYMMRVCLCVIYHFLMFEKCNISLCFCSSVVRLQQKKVKKKEKASFFSLGCLGKYLLE